MAQKVEELVTIITGNSSGLEGAFARATAAAKGNAKAEKTVADEISRIRKRRENEAVLAPIREAAAAQKSADARVRIEQRAADKEKAIAKKKEEDKAKIAEKQKAASTLPVLKEELLGGNFARNAKNKIAGGLQSTLGLSEDAAQGVATRLAKFAPYIGLATAGAGLLVKSFLAGREVANQQADKMRDLSNEMQRASRTNIFASSTDGVDSLSASIEEARQNVIKSKQTLLDDDPTEQGGNIFARGYNALVRGASKSALQFGADIGFDTGAESATDRQARERQQLVMQQTLSEKEQIRLGRQRSENINRDLVLTHSRLTMDQQTVNIQELQVQKATAIAGLRKASNGSATKEDIDRTGLKFDLQIRQQEELRDAMSARQNLQEQILGLANRGMTAEQQAIAAAQMKNDELDEEISRRKILTVEEQRAFQLERAANQNTIREAQLAQVMRSPAQQNKEAIAQRRREVRLGQAQDRINATDGLRNIERDINGNVLGGTDIVTGQRRAVSSDFTQNKDRAMTGYSTFRQGGGFLGEGGAGLNRPSFERPKYTIPYQDPSHGSNDQNAGNTLLSAAKAQVEATNISNDYLKNISERLDQGGW